jgi:hypothetical protein
MNDRSDLGPALLEEVLGALGEELVDAGETYDLVVIGGSALLALGLIPRPTRDVDVVALRTGESLSAASPLPPALVAAAERVARVFGLAPAWLNAGPAELLRFGLPEGFVDRLTSRRFGPALTVHFASRIDQIHFKLYAMVDQGAGRHQRDLEALAPSEEELLEAARWARSHDPSEGFLSVLLKVLTYLGVNDADLGS